MTFITNKEFTRQNINAMTEKFLAKGGEIQKLESSYRQENDVRKIHSSKYGRTGWFEMK